ncbi:MAG: diacylglycerol/lipid kinase family protein [Actinomycetota bacterium]
MTWSTIAAIAATALVVTMVAAIMITRRRRHGAHIGVMTSRPSSHRRRAAIIVNPTKINDLADAHRRVRDVCQRHGWADPLWLLTTADDPGAGQARQARSAGVALVCVWGGDGTVRAVADALVHSAIPVGLLSGGTGNLLARNLGLPVAKVEDALAVALTGVDRRIDVGWVRFIAAQDNPAGKTSDDKNREYMTPEASQIFLVMTGLGFDAAMIAGAQDHLKERVGWLAYAESGMRHLRGPRLRAHLIVDGRRTWTRRIRSALVANCGVLTGGIVLIPAAKVDDGWLDLISLSPKGILSWITMTMRVLLRRGGPQLEHSRCRRVQVTVDRPTDAQVDGDPVGKVHGFSARIDTGALLVRVPQ